jgi:hypothetical protein
MRNSGLLARRYGGLLVLAALGAAAQWLLARSLPPALEDVLYWPYMPALLASMWISESGHTVSAPVFAAGCMLENFSVLVIASHAWSWWKERRGSAGVE